MITTGKYPNLRLRRNREHDWIRRLTKENTLSVNDLVQPIFIIEGKNKKIPITSMPGVYRYSIDKLNSFVKKIIDLGIPMIALFPYTERRLKDNHASEALNENNLVCKATKLIKKKFGNKIGIMCDVALDPYTSHGHDGILKSNKILNDKTIDILIQQSIIQAKAGCDVIAPSDMMDRRILKIRKALSNVNKNEMIEFDIIFILGSSVCKSRECNILNSKISKENDRFKDMIFLSTVDTYKTSAMKMLEFYKFVVENFNTYFF